MHTNNFVLSIFLNLKLDDSNRLVSFLNAKQLGRMFEIFFNEFNAAI